MENEIYYFTFGQIHTCPKTGVLLKDYWIEVFAGSFNRATAVMNQQFGKVWSNQYHEKQFMRWHKMFPNGCYARLYEE